MASHLIRLISSSDIPCLRPRRIPNTRITLSATSNTLNDILLRPMSLSSEANCLYVQKCYTCYSQFCAKKDAKAVLKAHRDIREARSRKGADLAVGDTA